MMVLAPHGDVAKTLPVVRLATQAYCVCWCCCWGWTSCHNTWPPFCQFLCWLGICKDLKALSQTLQRWTLSLSYDLSPHTALIQSRNNMISLTNLPSTHAFPLARHCFYQIKDSAYTGRGLKSNFFLFQGFYSTKSMKLLIQPI
jgi:hypothetical protein